MKLESSGLIISLRPFGERDMVGRIFTRDNGVLSGLFRAGAVAKNKPMVGQVGAVTWGARLDSQLGVFHFETQKNLAISAMMDNSRLPFLNSMFSLLDVLLPEREAYSGLYAETLRALDDINRDSYLGWEICLLRELGYALDLSQCSGCGCTDELVFLSPRTGRAVCSNCGKPYVDKLFKLPINLQTTLRFLEGVCRQQDIAVPDYRIFLHRN